MWARVAAGHSVSDSYLMSVACVGAASCIRLGLGVIHPEALALVAYYPAVLVASVYGGYGPGLLAAGLSISVAATLFLGRTVDDALNCALFLFATVLMVSIAGSLRRLVADLEKRTAALEQSCSAHVTLIKELHHYGGNDTQVIASGLRMLKQHVAEDEARAQLILVECEARTRRLMDFHEQLSARVLPLKSSPGKAQPSATASG